MLAKINYSSMGLSHLLPGVIQTSQMLMKCNDNNIIALEMKILNKSTIDATYMLAKISNIVLCWDFHVSPS